MAPPSPPADITAPQVQELLLDLTKTVRAHHLYRPENPAYRRFVEAVQEDFASLWEGLDELELLVSEDRITWAGVCVYETANRADSLAFLLHKDGVRGLRFLRGFEEHDVEPFLDVLEKARYARAEGDDLVTLLWERNLSGLQYSAAELVTRGVELPSRSDDVGFDLLEVRRLALEEEHEGETAGTGGDGESVEVERRLEWAETGNHAQEIHPTLHVLREEELARLEEEVRRERERPVRNDVSAALLDSLELEQGEERTDVLRCLGVLVGDQVREGELAEGLEVLSEAAALVVPEGAGPSGDIDVLTEALSGPDVVEMLVAALVDGGEAEREAFHGFLPFLGAPALVHLYRHAAESDGERDAGELLDAARALAVARPEAARAALDSDDAGVLMGAATVLADLEVGGAAERLAPLLDRPEVEVRRAAARALAVDSDGCAALARAIEDEDSRVRTLAVTGLARHEHRPAAAALERAVRGRGFGSRGLTEIRCFLDGYAALAGDGAVALLGELLNARGLLGPVNGSELRACAARALAIVGSAAAGRELDRAAGDRDRLVRHAVEQASGGEVRA